MKNSDITATFTGYLPTGWTEEMTNVCALYPAQNSISIRSQAVKSGYRLVLSTIEIPNEQTGSSFEKTCHFWSYGGSITTSDNKPTISLPNKFTLVETVLKFKYNLGGTNFEKIILSLVDTTSINNTVGIVGQYNITSSGNGINGVQGKAYWDVSLKKNDGTFNSEEDIYAVIRRVQGKSEKVPATIIFKFYSKTDENPKTKVLKVPYTGNQDLANCKIYDLGTISWQQ